MSEQGGLGKRRPFAVARAAMLAAACGVLAGCIVESTDMTTESDADTDRPAPSSPAPPPSTVFVRLVNNTDVALDPQLYVSSEAVTAEELLDDSLKHTAFGFGTLGFLEPRGAVEVQLPCAELAVFGTAGGSFGVDLNAPEGAGQARVVRFGESILCGERVTFLFNRTEGGFATALDLEQ